MALVSDNALADDRLFKDLGPEPLEPGFDAAHLAQAFKLKKAPIKAALLDQHVVAGLGNIYVCEALWRSRIAPERQAASLTAPERRRLVEDIKAVLAQAIEAGGSSLKDFKQTSGELGYFQHAFAVYDREDQPCSRPRCRGTIARIVQSNRSTFLCPQCQK
jgi:formamidopyrimidine-DNA glycosylase